MEAITVTPRQLATELATCFAADIPAMIWGSPGIGKSQITAQAAAAYGADLFDVRLNIKELPDLSGYLCLDQCRPGEPPVLTAPADLPPMNHPGKSVLFLDEINGAPREVEAGAYGLVLERRLNSYRLPTGCRVVAAGNLQSDRGVTNSMPTPLKNRFVHFTLEPSRDDWLAYEMARGINPAVLAWHHFKRETLMVFDPKAADPAFASPRSWESLSRLLDANSNPSMALICGTIGTGVGVEFAGFLKVMAELPPADLIWLNPGSAPVPSEPSACYAIAANLAGSVTVPTMPQFCQYISRFSSQEYSVLAMDIATRRAPEIAHTAAFRDWGIKHQYILGLTN